MPNINFTLDFSGTDWSNVDFSAINIDYDALNAYIASIEQPSTPAPTQTQQDLLANYDPAMDASAQPTYSEYVAGGGERDFQSYRD